MMTVAGLVVTVSVGRDGSGQSQNNNHSDLMLSVKNEFNFKSLQYRKTNEFCNTFMFAIEFSVLS